MKTEFHVVIPARYHSTRFPAKLLQEIHGQTVLERVYRRALLAKPKSITIATDHELIFSHARELGASVVMTEEGHQSGTDRIAEVVRKGSFAPDDIIVNVQGDEPFMPPQLIQQVADNLDASKALMSTLCWPIDSYDMVHNPNVVKVVFNKNKQALYFSRSPIPAHRDTMNSCADSFRHIGIYAYRAAFLLEFVTMPVCIIEKHEALEQLRALWAGVSIQVDLACVEPRQDVNTIEDLECARALACAVDTE